MSKPGHLTVVPPTPPAPRRPKKVRPEQLLGVESPARVMLIPALLGTGCGWWSHDQVLVGGVEAKQISNGDHDWKAEPLASNIIGHAPTLVPAVWGRKDFHVVFEYEALHPECSFSFRVHYGCGDPSELHLHGSEYLVGTTKGKARLTIPLAHVDRIELLRVTLQILRRNGLPVVVYGAWLEIGLNPK